MKPLIGLTPTPQLEKQDHGTFRRHTLSANYSDAVIAAGGIPVMLPSSIPDIGDLLDRLDGVIATGGGDIDPSVFGQEQHETTDEIDAERDAFELALIKEVVARDMPLLGICRGLQIMNVAFGGTLHQDIDALVENSHQHRQQNEKIHHEQVYQTATLTPGDHPLRNHAQGDQIEINSFHHQCINVLASPLVSMAETDDGVIEAVYHPQMSYGMAVQWHPEMLASKHAEHASIFSSLIEAANSYRWRISNREARELV